MLPKARVDCLVQGWILAERAQKRMADLEVAILNVRGPARSRIWQRLNVAGKEGVVDREVR